MCKIASKHILQFRKKLANKYSEPKPSLKFNFNHTLLPLMARLGHKFRLHVFKDVDHCSFSFCNWKLSKFWWRIVVESFYLMLALGEWVCNVSPPFVLLKCEENCFYKPFIIEQTIVNEPYKTKHWRAKFKAVYLKERNLNWYNNLLTP